MGHISTVKPWLLAMMLSTVAVLGYTAPASAADAKSKAAPTEAGHGWENGGDIYGFSDNPDTPEKDGWSNIKLGWIALHGKRFGSYNGLNTIAESEYRIMDGLSVTPAFGIDYHRVKNVPTPLGARLEALDAGSTDRADYYLQDRNRMLPSYASLGVKWRLIERGKMQDGKLEGSPIGFALTFEPKYSGMDDPGGDRLKVFTFSGAAVADMALVPERLFLAVNIGAEMNSGRYLDFRAPKRESKLAASSTLSYQVLPGWFFGIEGRHEIAYSGTGFGKYVGAATYVGPAFYGKIGGIGVQAAWNAQIAGHSSDEPGQKLYLTNFERHRARLRLSYDF